MRKRKLFQLLAFLSTEDLQAFQLYLGSPFFNKSKTLLQFWECCRAYLKADATREPSVAEFLAGSDIPPRRMDRLCSELKLKVEDFLVHQDLKAKNGLRKRLLLESLYHRRVSAGLFQTYFDAVRQEFDAEKASSENYFHHLRMHWMATEVAIRTRETRSLWNEDFQDLRLYLDRYYQLQRLKLRLAAINAARVFKQASPADTAEDAVVAEPHHSPLAHAYALTIELFRPEVNETKFVELLELLGDSGGDFAKSESLELYNYALNFCIRQSNEGQQAYLEHAGQLYIQILEQGIALENGKLSAQHFKNIVALFCHIGKLDWVQNFVAEYGDRMANAGDAGALPYNQAVIAFHLADYARAIHLLKEILLRSKDDVFYALDARIYLWKSYFEFRPHLSIEQVDEMERLYDSFRIFIDRNTKIAEVHKVAYRNFIREFKKFMEALDRATINVKKLTALRARVAEHQFMPNKKWFLEKIDQEIQLTTS